MIFLSIYTLVLQDQPDFIALHISKVILQFSLYPTKDGEFYHYRGIQTTEKMRFQVKTLKVYILLITPRYDILPDLCHYHSNRGKTMLFRKRISPLAEREEEGRNYEGYAKLMKGFIIRSVNRSV